MVLGMIWLGLLLMASRSESATEPAPRATSCKEGEFLCKREGFCMPETWACDGVNDCGDNSDEDHCFQGQEVPLPSREEFFGSSMSPSSTCSGDEFKCQDFNRSHAHCVARERLCDGRWDCSDGSDEGGFCGSCPRYGCAGLCHENPILGPSCSCAAGLVIGPDGKSCVDMDECAQQQPCNHGCQNEAPGFRCTCATGFRLLDDSRTCGLREPNTVIFTTYNHRVVRLPADALKQGRMETGEEALVSHGGIVPGIDFDSSRDRLLLSSTNTDNTGTIHSSYLDRLKSGMDEVAIENVQGLGNLAVDWITGLIYFTTSGGGDNAGGIGLCTGNGRFCTFLNLSEPLVHRPRGLVVHPRRGLLFWSDWDTYGPRIEVAAMDGSNRVHNLVANKLEWPNALALDYATESLYWADAQYRFIERLDLHTLHREIVVAHNVHHPYDLVVFNNRIYWTDW